MNGLTEFVQRLIELNLGLADRHLGCVYDVCKLIAPLLDARTVAAFVQFNPLRLQEVTKVVEKFIFFNCFHISLMMSCKKYRSSLS